MYDSIFKLTRDIYTLKAEYEMNMQQQHRVNERLNREVDRLIKKVNDLCDSLVRHESELHS